MTSSCEILKKSTPKVVHELKEQLKQASFLKSRRVIIIAGPTGVGKTAISLHLAQLLKGEIVSADSMCVYRGMDIGTAKVSRDERIKIPHHLIDICDIKDPFNVCDFCAQAHLAIEDILSRGGVPIVVGGTGFYIHHLIYGPPKGPAADPKIRHELEKEAERLGYPELYKRLSLLDPDYAKTITGSDRHKIIRALEILKLTGKPLRYFQAHVSPMQLLKYDYRCWFFTMPRELLKARIAMRLDEMLSSHFLHEVEQLSKEGLLENRLARSAVGYRQALDYLQSEKNEKDYRMFVEKFKIASNQLAKRQCTWFKKEPLFRSIDISRMPEEYLLDLLGTDYISPMPYSPSDFPIPPFISL
jgi:tRNA dimethylallyltransferase